MERGHSYFGVAKKRKAWTRFVADISLRTRTHEFVECVFRRAREPLSHVSLSSVVLRSATGRGEGAEERLHEGSANRFYSLMLTSNHHFKT